MCKIVLIKFGFAIVIQAIIYVFLLVIINKWIDDEKLKKRVNWLLLLSLALAILATSALFFIK